MGVAGSYAIVFPLRSYCSPESHDCAAEVIATPLDDAATINRILADWKSRWERLDRVTYRLEGTREYKAGSMTGAPDTPPGPVPEKNIRSRVERRIEIDFRNGRSRHESDLYLFGPGGSPTQRYSITMFDGKDRVQFLPRERQEGIPKFVIWSEIHYDYPASTLFFDGVAPPLFSHGIVRVWPDANDVSRPRTNAEDFKVLRRKSYQGTPCVVLGDNAVPEWKRVEVWVDEDRASAITRADYYVKDRICWSLFDIDYGERSGGCRSAGLMSCGRPRVLQCHLSPNASK